MTKTNGHFGEEWEVDRLDDDTVLPPVRLCMSGGAGTVQTYFTPEQALELADELRNVARVARRAEAGPDLPSDARLMLLAARRLDELNTGHETGAIMLAVDLRKAAERPAVQ